MAPTLSAPNSNEITETHSQNYEVVGYCTAKNSKPASVITWIAPPESFPHFQISDPIALSDFLKTDKGCAKQTHKNWAYNYWRRI